MPELTQYQMDFPITELRELRRGNREYLLMETVFDMLVSAVVQLGERVTELEVVNNDDEGYF